MNERFKTPKPDVLIAFPPAGSSGGIFANLRMAMPAGTLAIVPDLPGRGMRMRCPRDMTLTGLVAELADELPDRVAASRFAVFGTSFGSIMAFEYVRELQRRALPLPEAIIVSGRQPPGDCDDFADRTGWTDDQVWAHLLATQPDGNDLDTAPPELRELAIEWFKTDMRLGASYRYVPEQPLKVPIFVCQAIRDRGVSREQLAAWRQHTAKDFTIRQVTGGHFFYVSRPEPLIEIFTEVMLSSGFL